MPDATPSTPAPTPTEPHQRRPRGYFNQSQLEDLALADAVLAASGPRAADFAKKDIDAAYITGFGEAVTLARDKTSDTGQSGDASGAATLNAVGAERSLVIALQGTQAGAKQKKRMLEEDDDPTTNFSTEGYLIGLRLNPNRPALLQNADALIKKAKADSLPGYKTADSTKKVEDALAAYKATEASQSDTEADSATDRLERDKLIRKINTRRMAIQHAADGLWPYTEPANAPVRRLFKLPVDRAFNG